MPNQDSLFVWQSRVLTLAGIADGHGPEGHFVAYLIKKRSLEFMQRVPRYESPNSLLSRLFSFVSKQVEGSGFAMLSGAAFIVCLVMKGCVACANLGDCKAMMLSPAGQISWLSEDHNMDRLEERSRVLKCGGLVRKSDSTFKRVWYSVHGNSSRYGLNLTRSIGDLAARRAGVISEPQTRLFDRKQDSLIILGSDGFWHGKDLNSMAK